MTEEFDALQTCDPLRELGLALAVLLLGIVPEVALRFVQRWAASHDRQMAGVIAGALPWQPLSVHLLGKDQRTDWPRLGTTLRKRRACRSRA